MLDADFENSMDDEGAIEGDALVHLLRVASACQRLGASFGFTCMEEHGYAASREVGSMLIAMHFWFNGAVEVIHAPERGPTLTYLFTADNFEATHIARLWINATPTFSLN